MQWYAGSPQQVSVFKPLMSIAHRIVLIVFVLPVPGGPHISFREGEGFSIAETQSATAFRCERSEERRVGKECRL